MLYVLAGGPFTIIDTPHQVEVWGQPVEIPEDLARGAIASGALLLPADKFAEHGFTPEELQYSNARVQANAPAEFKRKHAIALQAARTYRDQLAANPDAKAPDSKKEKAK